MDLLCDFSDDNVAYKCFVVSRDIPNPHLVTEFVGEHIGHRSNKDVVSVSFISCNLRTFPRNLMKFFPNLIVIELISCNLMELIKEDLQMYKKLMYLGIVDNQLTQLPSDLFEYTPNIQYIDFSNNQITSIGPRIFDSIKDLKHANFSNNRNIDLMYEEDSEIDLDEFIGVIKTNCRPLESLKGISATKLTESIGEHNAAEVFFYSHRFDLAGLKRKAFMYMKEKMMPWIDEMMLEQPEKLIKMVERNKWIGN